MKNNKLLENLEELETILHIIPIGIWKLSIDGKLTFVNQTFCDITGISEEKFLGTNHYRELFSAEDAAQCELSDQLAYSSKESVTTHEKIKFADGKLHTLKVTKKRLENQDGEIIGLIGIAYDKTNEIDLENELKENENLLLEQSKLAQMGEMLNMIAHQWRQPLNALSASAMNLSFQNELDMLDKESIDETSEFIQSETQRMSGIINDFMEFNKSEANKTFYIYKTTDEVSKLIAPQLKNRSILLDINIDRDLEVFHNAKSIEHVLLNIITNARDAFEDKKDIVNKQLKIYTSSDEKSITLYIEDNAGGVPEAIIHKVFNPYFTTKEKGIGTGIGLYMSKRMIESIPDTFLSVKNTQSGAIFYITFKK